MGRRAPLGSSFHPSMAGTGVVFTYWWARGSSGTLRPTNLPSSRPQKPAQDTTMSAGITPEEVSTPVTLPAHWVTPVTVVEPRYVTPASLVRLIRSCTARAADARPSLGT